MEGENRWKGKRKRASELEWRAERVEMELGKLREECVRSGAMLYFRKLEEGRFGEAIKMTRGNSKWGGNDRSRRLFAYFPPVLVEICKKEWRNLKLMQA